jgi:hypothetical protein
VRACVRARARAWREQAAATRTQAERSAAVRSTQSVMRWRRASEGFTATTGHKATPHPHAHTPLCSTVRCWRWGCHAPPRPCRRTS